MVYKCRICGANDVEHPGDVCELCAIGQDPYAAALQGSYGNGRGNFYGKEGAFPPYNGGKNGAGLSGSEGVDLAGGQGSSYHPGRGHKRKILLGGGDDVMNVGLGRESEILQGQEESPVQVYSSGQIPPAAIQQTNVVINSTNLSTAGKSMAASKNDAPLTAGIAKNISVDRPRKVFVQKWLKTLFSGIPFMLENEITMFQVFPDYSGTSLNPMGNACDQVIVYGKLNAGAVSENNDIEVYGRRDASNNVVAKTIINKASGTTIRPQGAIPAWIVWAITIMIIALLVGVLSALGVHGVIRVVIIIFCIIHLPWVLKVFGAILGIIFSLFRRKG